MPVMDRAPCVVPWYAVVREMTLCFCGRPVRRKYCLASFQADSTDSLPLLVKNTLFRPGGARCARRSASSVAGLLANDHRGKNASSEAWRAMTSASSVRPWPTWTVNRPASPSRYLRPRSS